MTETAVPKIQSVTENPILRQTAELLHNAILAQIFDYVRVATENNCINVTAALLDHKNRNFGDFDSMDEFTLDL